MTKFSIRLKNEKNFSGCLHIQFCQALVRDGTVYRIKVASLVYVVFFLHDQLTSLPFVTCRHLGGFWGSSLLTLAIWAVS
jgi:hypothetical protein